jgi:transcription termination factor NusB
MQSNIDTDKVTMSEKIFIYTNNDSSKEKEDKGYWEKHLEKLFWTAVEWLIIAGIGGTALFIVQSKIEKKIESRQERINIARYKTDSLLNTRKLMEREIYEFILFARKNQQTNTQNEEFQAKLDEHRYHIEVILELATTLNSNPDDQEFRQLEKKVKEQKEELKTEIGKFASTFSELGQADPTEMIISYNMMTNMLTELAISYHDDRSIDNTQ